MGGGREGRVRDIVAASPRCDSRSDAATSIVVQMSLRLRKGRKKEAKERLSELNRIDGVSASRRCKVSLRVLWGEVGLIR